MKIEGVIRIRIGEGPATPNSAARWPAPQASPRQSISTNTLRMMGRRYVVGSEGATGFAEPFDMRDTRTGMEDGGMPHSAS